MKYKILSILFFLTITPLYSIKEETAKNYVQENDKENEEFETDDFWHNGSGVLNEIAFEMRNEHHEHHTITFRDKLHYFFILINYFFIEMPSNTIHKYWLQSAVYLGLKKQKENEEKTKQCA